MIVLDGDEDEGNSLPVPSAGCHHRRPDGVADGRHPTEREERTTAHAESQFNNRLPSAVGQSKRFSAPQHLR